MLDETVVPLVEVDVMVDVVVEGTVAVMEVDEMEVHLEMVAAEKEMEVVMEAVEVVVVVWAVVVLVVMKIRNHSQTQSLFRDLAHKSPKKNFVSILDRLALSRWSLKISNNLAN